MRNLAFLMFFLSPLFVFATTPDDEINEIFCSLESQNETVSISVDYSLITQKRSLLLDIFNKTAETLDTSFLPVQQSTAQYQNIKDINPIFLFFQSQFNPQYSLTLKIPYSPSLPQTEGELELRGNNTKTVLKVICERNITHHEMPLLIKTLAP